MTHGLLTGLAPKFDFVLLLLSVRLASRGSRITREFSFILRYFLPFAKHGIFSQSVVHPSGRSLLDRELMHLFHLHHRRHSLDYEFH